MKSTRAAEAKVLPRRVVARRASTACDNDGAAVTSHPNPDGVGDALAIFKLVRLVFAGQVNFCAPACR